MIWQIIMEIYVKEFFSFIKKNCNNKIPKPDNLNNEDLTVINNIKDNLKKLTDFINKQNLNEYIKMVVSFFLMQINILMTPSLGNLKNRPKKNEYDFIYNFRAD